MIFSINFSENRNFLAYCLFAALLSGCAVAPSTGPRGERVPLPLKVASFGPDKRSPQTAEMATVRWNVKAQGGVGERTYSFRLTDGNEEKVAQEGTSPTWAWSPPSPGAYRVGVIVRDASGKTAESGWSPEYTVAPMLEVLPVAPDKGSPQASETATVRWKAGAQGGVGKRTYAFRITDGKGESIAQEGPSDVWAWSPVAPGSYRVKVVVRDAIGNEVENGWSPEYTVVPKLTISSFRPDKGPPQAAEMATVQWKVEAQGGVGERAFTFRISEGAKESIAQEGPSDLWAWSPTTPGTYRVKAMVRDSLGNAAESAWSPEYAVVPKLTISSFRPDKGSPQAAEMTTIRWKVAANGGIGSYRYEFRTTDDQMEKPEQEGALPTWDWSPKAPGTYRMKVSVRDAIGNAVDSGWSSSYTVVPTLVASLLSPDPVSPQVAGMAKVRWKVNATGGVGERTIEFRTTDGNEEKREQGGTSPIWDWSPRAPGSYKVKAVVRDAAGNAMDSGWSPEYLVVPKLRIASFSPEVPPPQVAGVSTVRWNVHASGGVEEREYSFWISDADGERAEQKGLSPSWDWSPKDPGIYRVKGIVRDAIGNTVDSGWSPEYRIELTAGLKSLIAVMPLENLTGMPVAIREVGKSLVQDLKRKGLNLLEEDVLEKFMERHRIRYTGGLNRELGEALRVETGTNAVLFPSLELLNDAVPPKSAVFARLISTHRTGPVLWMDGAGMSGNDAPGFLLLGLINDSAALWDKTKGKVVESLMGYLSGKDGQGPRVAEKRFLPKSFHGIPPKVPAGRETLSIAVLPFRNDSTRRNAGEIMALHFIGVLSGTKKIDVVEPGEVRQVLLRSRTIMEGGLSLPQADILRAALNVDLVLTGIVTEYKDNGGFGKPKVEFSARVFDMRTRQIVWSSYSYNEGDDGVFFFDLGAVNTAHGMASGMVRSTVGKMEAAFHRREGAPPTAGAPPPAK